MQVSRKLSIAMLVVLMIGTIGLQAVSAAVQDQHNQLHNVNVKWHNGDINQINSDYAEGDVVPYRYELVGLPEETDIYLAIHYKFTKGGKYAFDFLATFDLTESGPITSAGGLFGDSTPLSTLTMGDVVHDALAIPDDPAITTDNLLAGTQYFTIGGDYASYNVASGPILTGDITGDSEKSITLKIRTDVGDDLQLIVAWGGHLAIGDDGENWPLGKGSGSILGAPYHQSVSGFVDANNNGEKDSTERSIGPGDRSIHNVKMFVVPEVPIGSILAAVSMFAALGIFYYNRQKRFYP